MARKVMVVVAGRRRGGRNKFVRVLIMTVINVRPVTVNRVSVVSHVRGAAMVTPEQVGERYLAVHHRMFRAVNDEMNGCGLSMARTKVLAALRERGPTRQNVLAAELGLSPHSITDIVDGLERVGMAERRPDATDRRAKLVAITDAGQAGLDVANTTRERLLKHVFGALSEADRATFLRLLDSLDEAAKRLISASATPDVPATVPA
jgi:DNA-binding MarR family transcriptional regulator